MDVKLNKYFFILIFLILLFGMLSLFIPNNKRKENIYFKRIENIFDKLVSVEEILNSEIKNYFENNKVSKYSIKEIRDQYSNAKIYAQAMVKELNSLDFYENLDKRYLVDILQDLINVIDNDFFINNIFYSSDEEIIKNLKTIMYDFKKVLNKYNVFKINFGIVNI